jgi:hydrogenase expression/formation protein HypD
MVEAAQVHATSPGLKLMEVCGTHTMAISASGLRRAIDPRLRLISGPGCPVCVTAQPDIDLAIELAKQPGVIITTFGDMMRVPGSHSSLEQESARGADVRIVYSPLDAVKLAQANPGHTVVFLGVGFETTIPTVAAAVKIARSGQTGNFLVLPLFKTMPQALRVIAEAPRLRIDGFIMPGHVSTIIGSRPYEFLVREFHKPCCVVGFEVLDLLQGIIMLMEQLTPSPEPQSPTPRVAIQYRRSVTPDGNRTAQSLIAEVFSADDAVWRGLGMIPGSGLKFTRDYAAFDARRRFKVEARPARKIKGCRCGDILLGAIVPTECRLFAKTCTPENPLGPCMVSSEGACAAYYKYER